MGDYLGKLLEKWLIVDIPLGIPPITVEGENNKGPILLSDDGESEQDCEVLKNIGEDGRKIRMMEPSGGTCEEISDNSEEESDPDSKSKNDEESAEEESDYEECKSSYKKDCDNHNKLTPPEDKEHVSVKETLP
ncbi:hypothetical protein H5410_043216 [Solanum commersonii]|uniref:Uncharacterized protein n=1 Tax=Solanum commersonii TaxID=4109 RepID=A0A9J5Y0S3_SOLCO|nr:hypothetical protein H5410_043216 [Solanum commersonii]